MRSAATPAYFANNVHDGMIFDLSRAYLFSNGFSYKCNVEDGGKIAIYTKKINPKLTLQFLQQYAEVQKNVFALKSCKFMLLSNGNVQLRVAGIADLKNLLLLIDKYF